MEFALEFEYDVLGFVDAAVRDQVAHGLRHVQADEEDVERRDRADDEGNLPAKARDQQVGDAGGYEPADAPEALEQHDEAAAQMARCVLAHERRGDRKLTAESEADEEAEDEQGLIVPGESAEPRRDAVEQHRDGEDLLAADAVGDRAGEHGAKRHADEANRANPAGLCGRESPVLCQDRQDEGDQARVHRVEEPAEARDQEKLVVEGANRQGFQAFENHANNLFPQILK